MTRIRFGAAIALLLVGAAGVTAQPGGKPPPVIQFKQFGSTPEQFYQSSITRWTGQLALDLEAVKGDVAGAKVAPAVRTAVGAAVDKALLETRGIRPTRARGAQRDKLYAAFADVEKAAQRVGGHDEPAPGGEAGRCGGGWARADNGFHQLAAAVWAGDTDPGRVKRRLIRLAEAIDDSTEDLRALVADLIPDRGFDRALALYAREARLLSSACATTRTRT